MGRLSRNQREKSRECTVSTTPSACPIRKWATATFPILQ